MEASGSGARLSSPEIPSSEGKLGTSVSMACAVNFLCDFMNVDCNGRRVAGRVHITSGGGLVVGDAKLVTLSAPLILSASTERGCACSPCDEETKVGL